MSGRYKVSELDNRFQAEAVLRDGTVPFAVEPGRVDVARCHRSVGGSDTLLVGIGVEATGDRQPGRCRGIGDQLHDDLMAGQRLATPIPGDEGEQAMLDEVPLDADGPCNAARV